MNKRQLYALLAGSLIVWSGNGWLPLLPIYATQLGAQPGAIGNYLALAYLALAAGSIAGGWLSDKLQKRRLLLILGGVLNVPIIWLMGRAQNVWQLAALTAGCYFIASMAITLLYILTGLYAEAGSRGKIFGWLALCSPVMMAVSSSVMGPVVDRWGFNAMFTGFAVFAILAIVPPLFMQDKVVAPVSPGATVDLSRKTGFGKFFYLLILACIISSSGYFVSRLGISLVMNQLAFTMTAISMTGAVGGLVAVPLLPIIGRLSDRVGRKQLLFFCLLTGIVGLLILAVSGVGWQFWVSAGLASIMLSGVTAVGSAMVTDIVPPASLGRGMSLFNATTWIGGIIGLGSTGHAVEAIGFVPTFIIAAALPLIAIILIIPIRSAGAIPAVRTGG
jgi:MFS family permease